MEKSLTKREEILFGKIYRAIGNYIDFEKFKKGNELVTDVVAIMIPILDEVEKKLAEKVEKEPEKPDEKMMSKKDTTELIIDAMKVLWETEENRVKASHKNDENYNVSITNYAASHSDSWSKAKAWLESRESILGTNLINSKLEFARWIITYFAFVKSVDSVAVVTELLDIIKGKRK